MQYLICLLLCIGMVQLNAQSQEKGTKKSTSPLSKLFKKQEKTKTGNTDLKEARSTFRSSKRNNKAAAARERAAREEIDVLKAQRKAERTGAATVESTQKEKPILGLFKKPEAESKAQNQNTKTDLKEARTTHRDAKKERKAYSAKQQLAREQMDLIKAQKKVAKTERKASKNNR